jgi:hypothetical protein
MIKVKIFLLLMALKAMFCPCRKDIVNGAFSKNSRRHQVEKKGFLAKEIHESSGLAVADSGQFLYTIGDGGNTSTVYKIDFKGKVKQEIAIPCTNVDWEEITKDRHGNLYIGDFGNNSNNRKDLRIYRYSLETHKTDTISFSYPDQNAFPPERRERDFDCEAFIFYNDSLYLFTKNRGSRMVHIYQLPSIPGKYKAILKQRLYINSMVTGAAFEPSRKEIALLSYGKIYFLKLKEGNNFEAVPFYCHRFLRSGQSEGLAYGDENTLFITNEHGTLFKLRLRNQ